ncbi:16.3 kDa [Spodoptera frugiperda ascovirus 1a]|uniref:16.3 kDa n=1 Tax=Spodoptera frugiperda ascovirus 1a TaxID=113370 RepID=Q0E4Y1_SFAVA|nr:16.3 kDa [Spodoptera frugiperda ascovirus 1a]CAL44720.1 16.3 kDa [Spodoptera frugiperda ascovirus 1a]
MFILPRPVGYVSESVNICSSIARTASGETYEDDIVFLYDHTLRATVLQSPLKSPRTVPPMAPQLAPTMKPNRSPRDPITHPPETMRVGPMSDPVAIPSSPPHSPEYSMFDTSLVRGDTLNKLAMSLSVLSQYAVTSISYQQSAGSSRRR